MRFTVHTFLICLTLANVCVAEDRLQLGWVHFQTVRESDSSGSGGYMAPNLVIRLSAGERESFVFSGKYASGMVPLRPGKYCMQLFTKEGRQLKLSPKEKSCFEVAKGERLEVGVVAAYDPTIEVLPPVQKLP